METYSRTTSKRRRNTLKTVIFLLIVAIAVIVVGNAIIFGVLKLTGHDVEVTRHKDVGQVTFEPKRYDSPNNGHHTQVDNDPDRFWSIVQQQEDKGHLDDYFVIQVPQDGTWITEYVVSWRDY